MDSLPVTVSTYFIELMTKHKITLVICEPRKTWRGLWKYKNGVHIVYVNNDLPMDQFLLTLAHEIAHALVYDKYDFSKIKPHGTEWKHTFQEVMEPALNGFLPIHIEEPLKKFMLKPSATGPRWSSITNVNIKLVSSVSLRNTFQLKNDNRVFQKIKQYRINWSCVEINTGKLYRIRGDAEII